MLSVGAGIWSFKGLEAILWASEKPSPDGKESPFKVPAESQGEFITITRNKKSEHPYPRHARCHRCQAHGMPYLYSRTKGHEGVFLARDTTYAYLPLAASLTSWTPGM